MSWEFDPERPIYLQLTERISLFIVSGVYPPGGRLPSVRELAAEARVNPNTMQRALAELEASGLVYAERTTGRFVTQDRNLIEGSRRRLAQQVLDEFYRRMEQLGMNRSIALTLAAAAAKEEQG